MKSPIDTYKQVNISQEVSQYRAVQLLLDGAIERLKLARHAQATGNPERRGLADPKGLLPEARSIKPGGPCCISILANKD